MSFVVMGSTVIVHTVDPFTYLVPTLWRCGARWAQVMPSGWLIEPETAEGEGEGGTVITYVVQMKVRT